MSLNDCIVQGFLTYSIMKIPGLTFSWKRALGISQAKQQISKKTGIPMSKAGIERKLVKLS